MSDNKVFQVDTISRMYLKSDFTLLNMTVDKVYQTKIGKKNTIYLPKKLATSLNIKEGDKITIKVENDNSLKITCHPHPFFIALYGKKYGITDINILKQVRHEAQKSYEYSP